MAESEKKPQLLWQGTIPDRPEMDGLVHSHQLMNGTKVRIVHDPSVISGHCPITVEVLMEDRMRDDCWTDLFPGAHNDEGEDLLAQGVPCVIAEWAAVITAAFLDLVEKADG